MVTEPLDAAERLVAEERFGAVVTVLSGDAIGTKAVVDENGSVLAGSLPPALAESAIADAVQLIRAERSRAVSYEDGDVFIEALAPPPVLVIFGAVDIAQELSFHAQRLGFTVIVTDSRPVFATQDRFPGATVLTGWPAALIDDLPSDHRTYVVVLSHDDRMETPALRWALGTDVRYIGAMGSRRTHAARLERLTADGFDARALERIHGPVGLDLGAERPGEVAISILAEIIHVRYGSGTGLSLRGRHGRIHRQRTEDEGDV
ncbi:MAG: XdhC family protein [Acidimicrobiia bacterium]|nr:XdhC family protein [Acidimicrobiia bacterium]